VCAGEGAGCAAFGGAVDAHRVELGAEQRLELPPDPRLDRLPAGLPRGLDLPRGLGGDRTAVGLASHRELRARGRAGDAARRAAGRERMDCQPRSGAGVAGPRPASGSHRARVPLPGATDLLAQRAPTDLVRPVPRPGPTGVAVEIVAGSVLGQRTTPGLDPVAAQPLHDLERTAIDGFVHRSRPRIDVTTLHPRPHHLIGYTIACEPHRSRSARATAADVGKDCRGRIPADDASGPAQVSPPGSSSSQPAYSVFQS
jgi:hypothetical protein